MVECFVCILGSSMQAFAKLRFICKALKGWLHQLADKRRKFVFVSFYQVTSIYCYTTMDSSCGHLSCD